MSYAIDEHIVLREVEQEIRGLWRAMHDARRRVATAKQRFPTTPEWQALHLPAPWDFDARWEQRCRMQLMTLLDCRRAGIGGASTLRRGRLSTGS